MTKKNLVLTLSLLGTLSLTAACTPMTANRGNLVQDHQMVTIEPGTSTKSDVLRAMGSPTTQDPFDDNTWYYIGQVTEKKGILDPKVVNERIVMVQFNEEGTVNAIRDVGGHREDIPFERSKTPTSGNEITVLQQFFGNLGKFNAASAANATQGQKGR